MEQLRNELSETADDAKEYINLQLTLYKLKSAKLLSKLLVKLLKFFIFTNIALITLIFTSFAAATFIDSFSNTPGLGFAVVALFFVMVGVVLMVMRKRILEEPVIRMVVTYFFGKEQ